MIMSSNMESETNKQEFYIGTDGGDSSEKPGIETINETEENDTEDTDTAATPMLNGKTEQPNKIVYQVGDLDVEVVSVFTFSLIIRPRLIIMYWLETYS